MRISDWSSDVCSSDLTRDPQYAAPDGRWVSPSALPILRGGKSAAGFGGDRERALALGVVEDVGGQQQFVRAVAFDEGRDAGAQLVFVAQHGAGQRLLHHRLLRRAPERLDVVDRRRHQPRRSEEHTSELQSLMRISYAVFCLKKKKQMT